MSLSKSTSLMTFFFRLFLGLTTLIYMTNAASHNEPCGPDPSLHCTVDVSLICHEGFCQCSSNQTLTRNIVYTLAWDATQGLCVGQNKSACVGTRQNAVPEGWKAIPCRDELTCVQLPDMPLGVGSCEAIPKLFLHGNECNENIHCDSSRSLICTDGTCACAHTQPGTSPAYNLIWDEEMNNCVASVDSTCIGTNVSPLAPGRKGISCVLEADCVEVAGQTPGVGICKSRTASDTASSAGSMLLNHPTSGFQFLLITALTGIMVHHF